MRPHFFSLAPLALLLAALVAAGPAPAQSSATAPAGTAPTADDKQCKYAFWYREGMVVFLVSNVYTVPASTAEGEGIATTLPDRPRLYVHASREEVEKFRDQIISDFKSRGFDVLDKKHAAICQ